MQLVVSKFGGSSMKDPEAMLRSSRVSFDQNSTLVLVSATYKTTDQLHDLISHAEAGDWNSCEKILFQIKERHLDILHNLTKDSKAQKSIKELCLNLETLVKGVFLIRECSLKTKDRIVSFGERSSSILFAEAMKSVYKSNKSKITIELFDSRKILKTDSDHGKAIPLINEIKNACSKSFNFDGKTVYIGQGYIGSDMNGATTTLGRGGSDYSAALFAEGIDANILEIWTDVAGIASTDPKICIDAKSIAEINYDEASEMAQYGAKILHPTTLVPAMRCKIPVFVGSSYQHKEGGTWIKETVEEKPLVRAITIRENQALLTVKTPKMLNAFGFMGKIFDIFTQHKVSVDCITTSEISVAISVDSLTLQKKKFITDLENVGEVITEHGFSLVSLIGNEMLNEAGLARRVFSSIDNVNIRMLCVGASAYNFNILLPEGDGNQSIKNLHKEFIS